MPAEAGSLKKKYSETVWLSRNFETELTASVHFDAADVRTDPDELEVGVADHHGAAGRVNLHEIACLKVRGLVRPPA